MNTTTVLPSLAYRLHRIILVAAPEEDQKNPEGTKPVAGVVQRNIKTMLQLRKQAEQERGIRYRLANFSIRSIGSLPFMVVQFLFIMAWIAFNLLREQQGLRVFDPYPFSLLSTVIAIEAIFIAILILLNQNHMTDMAKQREELDLQISLLTEHEVTQLVRLVDKIFQHLHVEGEKQDITDLKKETSPEKLLEVIEQEMGKME